MTVCQSLFILFLCGNCSPHLVHIIHIFTYSHAERETVCNLVRKMRSPYGRTDIFSALTEDKQFSNENPAQRIVGTKGTRLQSWDVLIDFVCY